MQSTSRARLALYRSAVAAVVCLSVSPAAGEVLGPVRVSGAIETGYGSSRSDDTTTIQRNYGVTVNAASYIWQPWFANVMANLGFTKFSSETLKQSDTDAVTGRVSLGLFPVSRFPFNAFFDSYDSRIQQGDSATAAGSYYFRSRRIGFSQQYSPIRRGSTYGFSFQQTQQDDNLSTDEPRILDVATLNSSQSFGKHGVTLSGQHFHAYGDEQAEQGTNSLSVRHSVRPYDRLSLDNSLSVSDVDTTLDVPEASASFDLKQESFDLASLLSWQAKKRPLSLTGNFNLAHYTTTDAAFDNYTRTLSGGLNASYRYTRQLTVNGSTGYVVTATNGEEVRQTFQRGGGTYSRSNISVGDFAYGWSVNGSLSNQSSTPGADHQGIGTGFGHSLSRSLSLGNEGLTVVSLSLSESAATSREFGGEGTQPQTSLNHAASVAFARPDTAGSSNLSVNVTDTRSFSVEDSAVQTLGMSGGIDRQLGRYSGWGSNLAMNKAWISVGGDGGSNDSFENSVLTGYYRQRRFLNVWRLGFETNLQLDAQHLLPWEDSEEQVHQVRWENRWHYSIGLLSASLSTQWTQVGDSESKSFSFRVRRSF